MNNDKCNICGGPYTREFKDELGKKQTERIDCLGHTGILGYYWNMDADFKKFEDDSLRAARQRAGLSTLG